MTNPIPAWFPKQKTINWCMGGNWSKEEQVGRNQAIEDCLTAFKENMPTVEEIHDILYKSEMSIGNEGEIGLLGHDYGTIQLRKIATAIHTRLMEGKW